MAATTTLLGLVTPTQGTLSGTWGDTVNYGITDYVDISVAGTLTLTGDGAVTLANTTGSSSGNSITSTLAGAGTVTAQFSAVRISGTTTTKVVTGPSYSKSYLVDNASSFAVTFKASGQTGVSISPNEKVYVYYNATDYVKVGGGGITYGAVKTTTYTAVANDGVLTNTTSAAFTVNLPATPATGTQVFIADSAGTWATNNLTIGRNGSTIEGSGTDLVCDINGVNIQCVYNGTTWDIFAQVGANDTAVVTLNGTQTLTNKTLTAPTITSPTVTGTGTIAAATVTLSSTLSVTGVSTLTGGAVIQGLTVGRGAGAVSTNTAVGASALAANTGVNNTSIGYQAATVLTSANNTVALGYRSIYKATTGYHNVGVGASSLYETTTGFENIAIGTETLFSNTTGDKNTAVGGGALFANTTADNNTAVGYQAGYTNTTGNALTSIGYKALFANTTGVENTAVGQDALGGNTTGAYNTGVGVGAGKTTTTGNNNTSVGWLALHLNTTASNNTAVGYQAGYSNTTGANNVLVGAYTGYDLTTGSRNTFVGGYVTGGGCAGSTITTGSANTIIGAYNGNQGGLDIRTASNYIVLSDGDGNPRGFFDNNGKFTIGATASSSDRLVINGPVKFGQAGDTNVYVDFAGSTNYLGGSGTIRFTVNTGGVQLTSGATSWASASDERLKDIIEPITDAMAKVSTLRTVMGKYKTDAEGTRRPFLIAQDVIAVLPEAVDSVADTREGDETEYLSVRYTDTIPLLIAAIKELKAEFDAYKATHP